MTEDSLTRSYGLSAAPEGLSLAQDLLNSGAPAGAAWGDPLVAVPPARRWLRASLRTWSDQTGRPTPRLTLGEEDLAPLRTFRAHVSEWLATGTVPTDSSTVSLSFDRSGVGYAPTEAGAAGVAGLVLVELLLASRTGTLGRLKQCANPGCGAAFYDESRNSSRVWHDAATCGNLANLRASRERRRRSVTGSNGAGSGRRRPGSASAAGGPR